MTIKELLEEAEFKEIRAEIDEFVVQMLEKYLEDIHYTEDKQIFDFVWGPVEFNSGEIAILDSPLIQRLRKIKHLGLAGYVYCNADYSRFSHTVGVFFIANKMANIIRKNDKNNEGDFSFVQVARLAALFHDVGHMYFSHVSETFFSEDTSYRRHEMVKSVMIRFAEVVDKRVPLHEILSVMIVNSPKTKELLYKVGNALDGIKIKQERDIDRLVEYISCMIVGIANDKLLLPYHQIINGSVDADKCDYLSRDSRSTNVPVAVDIDRLIHKLSVVPSQNHEQRHDVWVDDGGTQVFYVPVIKASAEEALNQLLMSRNIMFRSVYYHQKVRTAETMLKNLISEMNTLEVKETMDFCNILKTTDDFFGMNFSSVVTNSNSFTEEQLVKVNELAEKVDKLNYRFLLKRVCAISTENIEISDEKWFQFSKKIFQTLTPATLKELEECTAREYEKVCNILGLKAIGNESFMISEFPKYKPDNSKLDAKISYGNGQIKKASEVFQTETWMSSKDSRNKEHYLLTDSNYRGVVFLAFQKALYSLHGAKILDNSSAYSKVDSSELWKDKKSLLEKGYYNDALSLVSEIIFEGLGDRVEAINMKFKAFEGKNGSNITKERIYDYLKQFLRGEVRNAKDGKFLVDGILKLLENAEFINRRKFDESVLKLLKEIESEDKILLCPIGGEKDSAKHMMYYFNDILNECKNVELCSSLQNCLEKEGSTILFFDDGAYSGKQVVSIFQEYFGIEHRATKETHVKELNAFEIEKIKQKKIVLGYIFFNENSAEYISSELLQLGLENIDIRKIFSMGTKLFEVADLFESDEQMNLLKEKLTQIGYELLMTTKVVNGEYKQNWNEERVKLASLGYNDSQQMVILKSSVPTYTITALWMSDGIYNEEKWIPLFERTDK